MFPYQLPTVAAQHAKDLRGEAAAAGRAARARGPRAAARSGLPASRARARVARRPAHP
jgi:hypothetical protein